MWGRQRRSMESSTEGFSSLASRSEIATLAPQGCDDVAALQELLCHKPGHLQGELSLLSPLGVSDCPCPCYCGDQVFLSLVGFGKPQGQGTAEQAGRTHHQPLAGGTEQEPRSDFLFSCYSWAPCKEAQSKFCNNIILSKCCTY